MTSYGEALGLFYPHYNRPSRPGDPAAVERFEKIARCASRLVEGPLSSLPAQGRVRVLDAMAASGIAGAAFSKALASRGEGGPHSSRY
jgi:hypothetical protein